MVKSAKDLTGTIIAQKYKLLKLLGEGGMGTVYQAQDVLVNRTVALKVLRSETDNEEAVRRFQREATIAARIESPYCVGLLDFGVADDRPFLVMPYVDGRPLSDVIDDGPLPPPVAIDIFLQICEGLQAAHAKGVVHRDIKPSNVILVQDRDGYAVKILDFGIAKLREPDATAARTMTGTGEFLGSPKYMSPEQCEGLPADQRSDIYSLGILMYETLTGEPPFKDDNVFAIIEKHRKTLPAPLYLTEINKGTASLLQSVVFRCLEKQREDRYQAAFDVERALKNVSEQLAGRRSAFPFLPFQALDINRFFFGAVFKGLFLCLVFVSLGSIVFYRNQSSVNRGEFWEKRRIEVNDPRVLPSLNSEEREEKDKRAQFKLSSIKGRTGELSDEYIRVCNSVGDYFRAHREFDLAMKYYGVEAPLLGKMGLGSSPEAAVLFIKQAQCCLPSKYALELQRAKLTESIIILDPLRHVTEEAAVHLIQSIFLRAQCELFSVNAANLPASERSRLLHEAEFDFNSVLMTYKDTLKQRKELYPSEMADVLLGTGNYFLERSRTATDADAHERCANLAIESYKDVLEQCASHEDYAIYQVAALNQIGLAQLVNKKPSLAIESFCAARARSLRLPNSIAREVHSRVCLNLSDAYWSSGDYRMFALEYFNSTKRDNN